MSSVMGTTIQRRRILVQGIVQGVGFRPFVYGQAQRRSLAGFVLNDSQGVTIEIEGSLDALDSFQQALSEQAPPLARIDAVTTELIPPCHENSFSIAYSQKSAERLALISPDCAICEDCLHELFDPADRRYCYAFINCTNCGPRFTIVQDVPYDREKTTMQIFPMCPACKAEYDDPLNRRFHAQPNACPVCGPQVRVQPVTDFTQPSNQGEDAAAADPISVVAQQLAQGAIFAIKGLGGYHLACDALNAEAVQRLRQRKHREAKPFALMVPDLETAHLLCEVSEAEAALLQSHRRPIVLIERRADCPVAPDVAPFGSTLGLMLPYTPLHYLLLDTFASVIETGQGLRPLRTTARPAVLVMTSGNLSDEPIAYRDDDARQRLPSIAEGILTHNRDIHMRCDDSVLRIVAGGVQFLRRARGYAPEPVPLSAELPMPLLACGGHLKNAFCLGKGRQAFVSHHIGDLENLETLTSFREGIEHFQRLFDIYPQAIAYDLHPEYLATKYALDTDIPQKIGVQHHHAHIASVLAEHRLSRPVIGIAADGTGFGTDGAIWGCEILVADLTDFERLAHLAYVPLPGGEQAVRQPWRMAATYLAQAYGAAFQELDIPFVHQLDHAKWRTLAQMVARSLNSPLTSSLGRLFDAVAALIGLRSEVLYEGQAAIELEMVATKDVQAQLYPFALQRHEGKPVMLDVAPTIRAIVSDIQKGLPVPQIANNFHRTIAELLVVASVEARERTGLNSVALSGGVFQNRLLLETLITRLEGMNFQVYINRRVPPNDGGLSLGQLAIAAARLTSEPDLSACIINAD
jgi:hydrogenase maturation protein HypF